MSNIFLTLALSSLLFSAEQTPFDVSLSKTDDALFQRLQVTDKEGNRLVDTEQALPLIENAYSPYSYNGYLVSSVAGARGKIVITDLQGESYSMLFSDAKAGDYLLLQTAEEGNGAYNFNLHFRYNSSAASFELAHILLNENSTSCEQSRLSTYLINDNEITPVSIQDFDGTGVFSKLSELRLKLQTAGIAQYKLMPEIDSDNFKAALQAYKSGDREKLEELTGYFIIGAQDDRCAPQQYMVEKYYYPDRVGWSNDLAFLLEQAGHYQEATVLLEHITLRHPDRTVAYLNLADAYWFLDKVGQAQKAYNVYYEKMTHAGKQNLVPSRVISRK